MHPSSGASTPRPFRASGVIALLSLTISAGLILSGRIPGRVAFDATVYHEPAARYFAQDWPHFDLYDYLSATTPGYHLLMAAVIRYVSNDLIALRLTGAAITAVLAGLIAFACARRAPGTLALLLAAAFMLSPYVVQSGAWMLPDNLGWLGVAAILVLLFTERVSAPRLVGAGAVLALLVFVRQSHVWTAGVILAAAWMIPSPPGGVIRSLVFRWPARLRWTALAAVCVLPSLGVLWWFWRLWHGLTPPRFATQHQDVNWATPAFVLSILGVISGAFLPWLWPAAVDSWRRARGWLILALFTGFALARIPDTTFSIEHGRSSGLWNIVRALPVEGNSSVLIMALSVFGALSLVVWVRALPQRQGVVFLAALVAFTAAQTANHHCWQRYVEPLVLMLTCLAGASLIQHRGAWGRAWLWPALLVAGMIAANVANFRPFPTIQKYREDARHEMYPPEGGFYAPRSGKHPPEVIRPLP